MKFRRTGLNFGAPRWSLSVLRARIEKAKHVRISLACLTWSKCLFTASHPKKATQQIFCSNGPCCLERGVWILFDTQNYGSIVICGGVGLDCLKSYNYFSGRPGLADVILLRATILMWGPTFQHPPEIKKPIIINDIIPLCHSQLDEKPGSEN